MFAYTKLMQAMAAAGVVSATDPYFNLTTLLLNTTATNGAQNNTFLDSSTNNLTITRNGNTTQGTYTPFSQAAGYWSNYFDGSASTYLSFPSNTAFAWGTGAYTVEGWIYQTARSTNETLFFTSAGSSGGFLAYITNTGAVSIEKFGTGAVLTGSAGDVPLNTWCHLAYVRSSTATNATNIYVNGVVKATGTDANDWTASSSPTIGMLTNNTDYAVKGYVSNARIVKGTAVYTAAFTPPTTPLTNITNTSLLTCQSNYFLDNSSNAFTVTPTGASAVQAFSPFLPTAAYSTSAVGGSGYFDGTGDYLNTPTANTGLQFGTGDFTVEFWAYPTNLTGSTGVGTSQIIFASAGSSSFMCSIWTGNIHTVKADVADLYNFASAAVRQGTWFQVAICRASGSMKCFVNGVQAGSTTADATDYSGTGVGAIGANYGGGFNFSGYIAGLRVLKGTALYSSDFSVPTTPPVVITNTSLLTNYTNAGIFDSTAKNDYETLSTAQVSTAQAKWGTTSMVFNGTSDYIVNPSSALVSAWGTGDFTVEGWYYSNNIIGTPPLWMNSTSNSDGMSGCYVYATGSVAFGKIGVNEIASATGVWSNSQWNHLAVVVSGATVYIYVNGVSVASGVAATYVETTTVKPITLGRNYQTVSAYYNGYIDDFRVTKGYARYPSGTTFTPPTAAFPTQ